MKQAIEYLTLKSQRLLVSVIAWLVVLSGSACFLLSDGDRAANSNANLTPGKNSSMNSTRPSDRTSPASNTIAPPANLIESLRAEMLAAASTAAIKRHPASKLDGDRCEEISFALYDADGIQNKYIGIYRCQLKGKIAGVSNYDSQVTVIGEIRSDGGAYSKSIIGAEASN